jgi:hypothetical protein
MLRSAYTQLSKILIMTARHRQNCGLAVLQYLQLAAGKPR